MWVNQVWISFRYLGFNLLVGDGQFGVHVEDGKQLRDAQASPYCPPRGGAG